MPALIAGVLTNPESSPQHAARSTRQPTEVRLGKNPKPENISEYYPKDVLVEHAARSSQQSTEVSLERKSKLGNSPKHSPGDVLVSPFRTGV